MAVDMKVMNLCIRAHGGTRISLAIAVMLLQACSCGVDTTSQPSVRRNGDHSVEAFVRQRPVLIPKNLLSGRLWDWQVLDNTRLSQLLQSRMPEPRDVPEGETVFQVLEKVTGKRIIFVPMLTACTF